MTAWDIHTWPNRPMPTREILDRVRALLSDAGDPVMRDNRPIAWAKSVCALGKLIDDQGPQIRRHRVMYNLGKHQAARLQKFERIWREIGPVESTGQADSSTG